MKNNVETSEIGKSMENIDKTKKNMAYKKIFLNDATLQKISLMIPAFFSEEDIKDKNKDKTSILIALAIDSLFRNEFKEIIQEIENDKF